MIHRFFCQLVAGISRRSPCLYLLFIGVVSQCAINPAATATELATRSLAAAGLDLSRFPEVQLRILVLDEDRAVLNLRPQDFSLLLDGQQLEHRTPRREHGVLNTQLPAFAFSDLGEAYAFDLSIQNPTPPDHHHTITVRYLQGQTSVESRFTFSQQRGLISTEGGQPSQNDSFSIRATLVAISFVLLTVGCASAGIWLFLHRSARRSRSRETLAECVDQAPLGLESHDELPADASSDQPPRYRPIESAAAGSTGKKCDLCGRPLEETFDYCIYCDAEGDSEQLVAGVDNGDSRDPTEYSRGASDHRAEGQVETASHRLPTTDSLPPKPLEIKSELLTPPIDAVASSRASPFDIVDQEPPGQPAVELPPRDNSTPAREKDLETTPIFQEHYVLCVERDGVISASYELAKDRKYLIGSNPVADIVVTDAHVGPIQARLAYRDGQFHIRNLNPSVALLVNGIDTNHTPMTSSHCVRIGETNLNFKVELRRTN